MEMQTTSHDAIIANGVKTHNLKSINVAFDLYKWTAVTGVSGSGKSSLVFDTIYAEAQRRFLETLGTYERQFLQGLPQGDFDSVENVPAAVALKQSNRSSDPRSLVGTSADIFEPLRQVFFTLMEKSCVRCGSPVESNQPFDLVQYISSHTKAKYYLSMPFEWPAESKKIRDVVKGLILEGFDRVFCDGQSHTLEDVLSGGLSDKILLKSEVVLDRFTGEIEKEELQNRVDSAWSQIRFSNRFSQLHLWEENEGHWHRHSYMVKPFCLSCNDHTTLIQGRDLDWQSVLGSCPSCKGLGNIPVIDERKVIPDDTLSLEFGAIKPWTSDTFSWMQDEMIRSCQLNGIKTNQPYSKLPESAKKWIWYGEKKESAKVKKTTKDFVAIQEFFDVLESERYKRNSRILLAKYRKYVVCPDCHGTRLGLAGRNAVVDGRHFHELMNCEIQSVIDWLDGVTAVPKKEVRIEAVKEVLAEVKKKLNLLVKLGLSSSALTRRCKSLSGGEYQRVLLTRVLGNGLTDALYVLDEPSVGLGRAEIPNLIECLKELRDLGNTIVMVEHDPELIMAADKWVELGPGGGIDGGKVLAKKGTKPISFSHADSFKNQISKRENVNPNKKIFKKSDSIFLENFSMLNCKNVNFEIPLSKMTVVSGPSGAGKTTLCQYGLSAALQMLEERSIFSNGEPNIDDGVGVWQMLEVPPQFFQKHKIVIVEQKAMHRSITSVIATVLGVMDDFRKIFASLPESKELGFTTSQFSFNGGGACPTCDGRGVLREDLFFLGEVEKICPDCHGNRYDERVLEVVFQGRNIAQWMATNVSDCVRLLKQFAAIVKPLEIATQLGLGHLPLGASTSEISGGEAQRLRLCSALSERSKKVFCILDEPTRGLSEYDISQLLSALLELTSKGHTFVVVEHHDMFKRFAHQLVEMGPGAGIKGGQIVKRELEKCVH